MDEPSAVSVAHYSPEHLCYTNGGMPADRHLAGAGYLSGSHRNRRHTVQTMGKTTMEVIKMAKRRGRPIASGNVHATPILRNPPDLQKLGRAVLRLAEHLAEKEKNEVAKKSNSAKEDGHAA